MFEIDEQLPISLIFLPDKVSCSMVVIIHVLRTLCMYVRAYVCIRMYVLITIMYASFAQYILNLLNISRDQFSERSMCPCMYVFMTLHCLSTCIYFYLQNVGMAVRIFTSNNRYHYTSETARKMV